jgi:uncharacterized protein YbbC (DUF1343 family)
MGTHNTMANGKVTTTEPFKIIGTPAFDIQHTTDRLLTLVV